MTLKEILAERRKNTVLPPTDNTEVSSEDTNNQATEEIILPKMDYAPIDDFYALFEGCTEF